MTGLVLREDDNGITTLTMNRPDAMNALSIALRAELAAAIRAADADPSVKVIILTGAGTRAFTAGLDLKELGGTPGALGAANPKSAENDPVLSMEACRKPIIGAVNGVAITGGFEVALACDVLIAAANARFADTHARVGILPGWGLSQKLSRAVGVMRAKELSLTGNFLDAETAAAWGLVNRVVPADELLPTARKLAADMASIPADTLADYKKLIDDGFALAGGEARALEGDTTSKRNAAVKPEEIEARRAGIQSRGRTQ
ncbi:putative enoyl-CoA hydratase echA8 [Alphaproteobacteria bacterium SO-S41]|nr:putative enoyl-CoA hydratase echA8 [Alphaproteobacteria bacterium SO-S41]